MTNLAERIEDARAEIRRLERLAASATCADLGHAWKSIGGSNAGCNDTCACSVPVHECARCGDCDYGDNAEAEMVRTTCKILYP